MLANVLESQPQATCLLHAEWLHVTRWLALVGLYSTPHRGHRLVARIPQEVQEARQGLKEMGIAS